MISYLKLHFFIPEITFYHSMHPSNNFWIFMDCYYVLHAWVVVHCLFKKCFEAFTVVNGLNAKSQRVLLTKTKTTEKINVLHLNRFPCQCCVHNVWLDTRFSAVWLCRKKKLCHMMFHTKQLKIFCFTYKTGTKPIFHKLSHHSKVKPLFDLSSKPDLHNPESLKGQIDQHKFGVCCISLFCCSLEEILEQPLLDPNSGFCNCNIFYNAHH